jgi:shikimate kinase
MGTGKSSVGKVLAQMTGLTYVDLDAHIVAQAGRSINEIFAEQGEAAFRALESALLQSLCRQEGIVLSTGGGAVLSAVNRAVMKAGGIVINLTAPVPVIRQRLRHATDRPLLQDNAASDKIERMFDEREACYAEADIRIDTAGKKIEDIAAEIMQYLSEVKVKVKAKTLDSGFPYP